jgi:hypothetical protein
LEAIKRRLARADSRVSAAVHAQEQAAQAKHQVEVQIARHRAVEDELRLEIHEETEGRLRVERQRSEENVAASIALVQAMGGPASSAAGATRAKMNEVIMADIQQQLGHGAAPLSMAQAMEDKMEAERRAATVRAEQEKAEAARAKAKRDLQRARKHLIEIRAKMQEAQSSNPD